MLAKFCFELRAIGSDKTYIKSIFKDSSDILTLRIWELKQIVVTEFINSIKSCSDVGKVSHFNTTM